MCSTLVLSAVVFLCIACYNAFVKLSDASRLSLYTGFFLRDRSLCIPFTTSCVAYMLFLGVSCVIMVAAGRACDTIFLLLLCFLATSQLGSDVSVHHASPVANIFILQHSICVVAVMIHVLPALPATPGWGWAAAMYWALSIASILYASAGMWFLLHRIYLVDQHQEWDVFADYNIEMQEQGEAEGLWGGVSA
jgi:hypothetical protein